MADRLSELKRSAASLQQSHGSLSTFAAGTESDQHSTTSSEKHVEASNNDPHVVGRQVVSGPAIPDASNHQTSEARVFLQRELESNNELPRDRYTVLESAIQLVDQISSTANLPARSDYLDGSEHDTEPLPAEFPPELCYMMTMGKWNPAQLCPWLFNAHF